MKKKTIFTIAMLMVSVLAFSQGSIPNIISSYTSDVNTFTYDVIVNSTNQVNKPRDLDFHLNGDLWITNTGTENSGGSTVKVTNPAMSSQNSLWEQDGNARHFMALPSGIAFSDNGNFATSTSVLDANYGFNGSVSFTGPTLWSSDPLIYAQPSGGNGSHLDMLHASPYSMGIASEAANVFWVYDDYSNDIVRYDFAQDHGPGNSYHDDGRVRRFQGMGLSAINHTIVNHLELDDDKKWLYFVDGGNQRILRLDITTGTTNGSPSWGPQEQLAEYKKMIGFVWEEVVTTGLVEPAGIDIIDDRLVVTDHSNGDIIFYDVSNIPATEIGRVQTNEPGIMGTVIGPTGRIWYANHSLNKVVKIEPSTIILETWDCNNGVCSDPGTGLGLDLTLAACVAACQISVIHEEILDLLIYPNPAKTKLTINGNYISVTIYDVFGKEVVQMSDLIKNKADISHLSSGVYFVNIYDGKQKITEKLIIE